jgi:hypothetical protein
LKDKLPKLSHEEIENLNSSVYSFKVEQVITSKKTQNQCQISNFKEKEREYFFQENCRSTAL